MSLKGQDVLVALRIALDEVPAPYAELGRRVGLSASQAYSSVQRIAKSGLLLGPPRRVNTEALIEFLVHGAKYMFPATRGAIKRGVPTAHSAPPLNHEISDSELPLVWAHPHGSIRGETLSPVYKTAPDAALEDPELYAALALLDAIRTGRARERDLATKHLKKLLRHAA